MKPSAVPPLPAGTQWLGYGGLMPFVALTAMVWWLPAAERPDAAFALTAYGAIIASFVVAIHRGLAMRGLTQRTPSFHFIWGIMPSLLAWLAMLLAPAAAPVLLAVLLGLYLAIDRATYVEFGLQHWLTLRLQLTSVAVASCMLAVAGLAP